QHDQIITATKRMKIPDLVPYIARDPEAHRYGLSLIGVLREIGMSGRAVMLEDQPPLQTGVMYCGTGTAEDVALARILMDVGIVGIGNPHGKNGHDKYGKEIVLP